MINMKKKVSHMNGGDGENSYASNSSLQKSVTLATLPIVDDAIKEMLVGDVFKTTTRFRIVDLGCSSGLNTIFTVSHILDKIRDLYQKAGEGIDLLEFEVFFNDLPDNDFNNLFKLLSNFNDSQRYKTCSWYGLPGSFYNRLFPSASLHLAFSCYSLHWLSQVPDGIDNNNKENIYVATTTPQKVFEAYSKQYQKDFTTFFSTRSKEMMRGGRMVLIIFGRRNYSVCDSDGVQLSLLVKTLQDMVVEGHVKMDDLHSFNVPIYYPYEKEVEALIHEEGSFNLHELRAVPMLWDACDDQELAIGGKLVSDCVRAYMEPMLKSHFGSFIVNQVFERLSKYAIEYMSTRKLEYWNIVISLSRK